jgi:RNase P/RNase MRP subunit p29
MKFTNTHLCLILFLSGILVGITGMVIFKEKKTVKVELDESAVVDYVKQYQDSLIKVYDHKFDSIQATIPKLKTEIKYIYKTIERENIIIIRSNNLDSLWKVANSYIKSN